MKALKEKENICYVVVVELGSNIWALQVRNEDLGGLWKRNKRCGLLKEGMLR